MTLADLRRANHMWTNDTIHLRKTLFIPLDKSPKARQIYEEQEEASEEEEDHESQPSTSSISDSGFAHTPRYNPSFSPRSLRPPSVHVRAPSSPSASPNLSSLFSSAIPIADTIISRLSLDGIPSERRRTSFEQEGANGHELLDVLPVRPSLDGGLERVQRGDKNLGHPRRAATTWDAWHATASRTRPSPLQASTSSPTDTARSIRTNQLEPQPEMLIPSRKSASMRSNASGRSHNTYSAGDNHQSQTHLPSPKKSRPGLQGLFEAPDGIEL
ncbi:hypothetical protein DL96DRAFT_1629873 [Flagelloscypha sp. PMI_526]|nr:hypothetical protein DL96DRAFT_1629873 [Flagelloscypha sp. PMI_526]